MDNIAVLIDGAYFDKIRFYDHNNARIDVEKLAHVMAGGKKLTHIFYYHCLPYQSSPPTPIEIQKFSSKEKFFNSISTIPLLTLRKGNITLVKECEQCGIPTTRQKRVDAMICLDIARLSIKKEVTDISLLTGDSDFVPAVELAISEGIITSLWHGDIHNIHSAPSIELRTLVHLPLFLSPSIVSKIIRPNPN